LKVHPDDVHVAVVLALAKEAASAQLMFADDRILTDPAKGFSLCAVPSFQNPAQQIPVVLASLPLIGNIHSAMCVMNLREKYTNLKYVLLCGIAGAVPHSDADRDVYLGDIVSAGSGGILYYDHGHDHATPLPAGEKAVRGGYQISPRLGPWVPDDVFLNICNSLKEYEIRGEREPWLLRIEERLPLLVRLNPKFRRPDETVGADYEDLSDSSRRTLRRRSDRNNPLAFIGAIATGNCVVKNPFRRDQLRDGKPPILAIEMEAAGVATACKSLGLQFTVIRGLCDYCDENKNDEWHHYAAAVAAAYTFCVIQRLPLERIAVKRTAAGLVEQTLDIEGLGGSSNPDVSTTASTLAAEDLSLYVAAPARSVKPRPSPENSDSEIREFLSDMSTKLAAHDPDSAIARAIAFEGRLTAIGQSSDTDLLVKAYAATARAYVLRSRRTEDQTEKDHFIRRATELAELARRISH
jgi:nucleoside phosphorylase